MSELSNIYGEVNDKLISNEEDFDTVLEEDKCITVKAVGDYCKGISILTNKPIDYFSEKLKLIDIIRFDEDDEILKELSIKNPSCRSYNFFKDNKYGIIVKATTSSDKEYTLMHELTHFFINTEEDESGIKLRKNLPHDSNKRLDEGITEKITQDVWDSVYPYDSSIGFRESRYLMEVQIATVLIDMMGKQEFLNELFENPKEIIDKLKSISYENTNLFDYLETQMEPLVEYRGRGEHNSNFDALNSFEALSDCHKMLKLEKKNRVIK